MNPRSLSFRLVSWYAGICLITCSLFSLLIYVGLKSNLEESMGESMIRRSEQIVSLWGSEPKSFLKNRMIDLIHASQAPEQNDRFIGIWNANGELIYRSGPPADQSFDPTMIPLLPGTGAKAVITQLRSPDMIICSRSFEGNGESYIVQVGVSRKGLISVLTSYRNMLLAGIAGVVLVAILGGILLVRLSLSSLDRMIRATREITVQNLAARLPVEETGDELHQLSLVLNQMIARLEEAFAHSQRFCALASHELRTPLTIILGEIEHMIASREVLLDSIRENLSSVYEEAEHLKRIVEALFAIARLDTGGSAIERKPILLSELVSITSEQMQLLAEEKDVNIISEFEANLITIGDASRLKQVIVNLLDNAIKFTPPGGTINLKTSTDGVTARLDIRDNGFGIPEHSLPYVFEFFFRAKDERIQQTEGGGIGLSIVKSICEAHQGSAMISNNKEGGCTVTIKLPLLQQGSSKIL